MSVNCVSQLESLLITRKRKSKFSEFLPDLFLESVQLFIERILWEFNDNDTLNTGEIISHIKNTEEYRFLLPLFENK